MKSIFEIAAEAVAFVTIPADATFTIRATEYAASLKEAQSYIQGALSEGVYKPELGDTAETIAYWADHTDKTFHLVAAAIIEFADGTDMVMLASGLVIN